MTIIQSLLNSHMTTKLQRSIILVLLLILSTEGFACSRYLWNDNELGVSTKFNIEEGQSVQVLDPNNIDLADDVTNEFIKLAEQPF
jgi:hypothetical protein